MRKRTIDHQHHLRAPKSQTLPPSPSQSSSSSDFEFTFSASPRKASSAVCPADELFYKGQLLPLHVSPRLSMVRTLILASSSTSSSSSSSDGTGTSTAASRDSTGSSNDSFNAEPDSSRRASSVAEEDKEFKTHASAPRARLFKKEPNRQLHAEPQTSSSARRMSVAAKAVITKYLKKVKPLLKLGRLVTVPASSGTMTSVKAPKEEVNGGRPGGFSHSFSGNLWHPRRNSSVSSCPSSTRSSPSRSGVLRRPGLGGAGRGMTYDNVEQTTSSSMDELQSAIQGAIAHCKNSLVAHKNNKTIMRST